MTPTVEATIRTLEAAPRILRLYWVSEVHLEDAAGVAHVGFQREIDAAPATFAACEVAVKRLTEAEATARPDKFRCLRCYPRRDRVGYEGRPAKDEQYGQREAS